MITYLEKSTRDRPRIRHELTLLDQARRGGEPYHPMKLPHKDPGLRTAGHTITWATLCQDDLPELLNSLGRRPRPASPPANVSTVDGKPIGWTIKR